MHQALHGPQLPAQTHVKAHSAKGLQERETKVPVHCMPDSETLSDCLARQHLHIAAAVQSCPSGHGDNMSPVPDPDHFAGINFGTSTVHKRVSSEFLPAALEPCSSRYAGLEEDLGANSPLSSVTSQGGMRDGDRRASSYMAANVSPVGSSIDCPPDSEEAIRAHGYHKVFSQHQQLLSDNHGCLYGDGKMVPPAADGGFELSSYLTNPSAPHSAGFDLLQDLQGQAGGGYAISPCPDESFLFQAGGVDRCLSQIYSI
ncbi:uncharacterized protein LOC130133587, partial [Lampris incognitus]|uniref:uncharacterized protein LOC130133587 n=1 Tax=Lampris incognitus TaxID=2546036 RepID=UPI0024B5901B